MTFKGIDDIEREKRERERAKLKSDISSDITEVLHNISVKRKEQKKASPLWLKIVRILAIVGLLGLVINFVLGNAWLMKFFIKGLMN